MIFLPFQIAAMCSSIAIQQAARQEAERIRLGLPLPPPPPPKSPEEIAHLEKLSRQGDRLMIAWFLFGAVCFTAPPTLLLYIVIKIAFAKQGIQWP